MTDSRIPNIDRIRQLQHGYTQEEFAERCGMSRQTLRRIYAGHRVELETLQAIAAASERDPGRAVGVDEISLPESASHHLCDRITRADAWPDLADALRLMVNLAGTSAMQSYTPDSRRLMASHVGAEIVTHQPCSETTRNPTEAADIDAVLASLRTGNTLLSAIASRLGCGLSFAAEELATHRDALVGHLAELAYALHAPKEFYSRRTSMLRVIADPLDGSMNHRRGIPFFCSAAALLVDEQPRLSAIFDPRHNVVYSASLNGPLDRPHRQRVASAWTIDTGAAHDLLGSPRQCKLLSDLRSHGIAVHLPRNDRDKRQGMIARLPALADACDSLYVLNSGLSAMVLVATGGLAAFVNPWTNLHDIAAGEVLCRAMDCEVTDWQGRPIKYNDLPEDEHDLPIVKTSLAVAHKNVHPGVLQLLQAA